MAAEPSSPGTIRNVRSCRVMAQLTLSALERASTQPGLWREPAVHRALLISGLSVLISGLAQLQEDLG